MNKVVCINTLTFTFTFRLALSIFYFWLILSFLCRVNFHSTMCWSIVDEGPYIWPWILQGKGLDFCWTLGARTLYTARQIWTKDVWKRAILSADVLSHQMASPLPPKLPQNPILGTFQCKPIIRRALCKSHVNGATKLKLYSSIGIGKYLGCVKKNFFTRRCPGRAL